MSEILRDPSEYISEYYGPELSLRETEIKAIPQNTFEIIDEIDKRMREIPKRESISFRRKKINELESNLLEEAKSDVEKKIIKTFFGIRDVEARADSRESDSAEKDAEWQDDMIEILSEIKSPDIAEKFWKVFTSIFEKMPGRSDSKKIETSIFLRSGIMGPLVTARLLRDFLKESEGFKNSKFYLSTPKVDAYKKIDLLTEFENYVFAIQVEMRAVNERLKRKEMERVLNDTVRIYKNFGTEEEDSKKLKGFKEGCKGLQEVVKENGGNKEIIGMYVRIPYKLYVGGKSKLLIDILGKAKEPLKNIFNSKIETQLKKYGIIENTTT